MCTVDENEFRKCINVEKKKTFKKKLFYLKKKYCMFPGNSA